MQASLTRVKHRTSVFVKSPSNARGSFQRSIVNKLITAHRMQNMLLEFWFCKICPRWTTVILWCCPVWFFITKDFVLIQLSSTTRPEPEGPTSSHPTHSRLWWGWTDKQRRPGKTAVGSPGWGLPAPASPRIWVCQWGICSLFLGWEAWVSIKKSIQMN